MARITHEDIVTQKVDGKKKYGVQGLRTAIRELTKQANAILLQNESRADYQRLAKRLQEASDSAAVDESGRFVGRLNFKTTQELEIQLQGLQQFIEYDTLSDQAKKKQEERFQKSKQTYEQNTKQEVTEAEYERIVQTFTSVSSIMEQYGSGNVDELNRAAASQNKKINITTAFNKADRYAEQHGILKTPENILDIVYSQSGIKRV